MLRAIAVCCFVVCALPRAAAAEWQLTPFVGLTFKGSTNIIEPQVEDSKKASERLHRHFGGAVTLLGSGILGAESVLAWTPGFFEQDDLDVVETSRTVAWMGNVVLTAPRRLTEYSLRPFVSGGFGLLRVVRQEKEDVFPVSLNLAGFNVGGGAVGFLSQRTGLRFDLRYYSTIRPTDEGSVAIDPSGENRVRLRYMTASVGVVFRR